jgi:hypothetical protein
LVVADDHEGTHEKKMDQDRFQKAHVCSSHPAHSNSDNDLFDRQYQPENSLCRGGIERDQRYSLLLYS